jgi:hypothetical protein
MLSALFLFLFVLAISIGFARLVSGRSLARIVGAVVVSSAILLTLLSAVAPEQTDAIAKYVPIPSRWGRGKFQADGPHWPGWDGVKHLVVLGDSE